MRDARITSWPVRAPSWRRAAWIALAILLVAGAGWWLYHRATAQTNAGRGQAAVPFPVVATAAAKGEINIIYNALGTVTPMASVTVKTQINGKLMQVAFQEGQMIGKGDLLAIIDPRPYELALTQAQGQLLKDQALLKQAQNDLGRYQTLLKQDSIAQQTVADQAQLVRQYEGAIKSDQGVVDNAKLNIEYCHIVAPLSGRVGLRQVDAGNYVTAGDTNGIVVITEVQPITTLFSLPEDDLPSIMKQLSTGSTLPVTAFDRGNTKQIAAGNLVAVDSQIDTTTGTVKMRAQFDNKDGALFPNQFVNVRVLADVLKDATVIPTSAIQRGAPGTFVYVVKPDQTVAVQAVTIGPSEGEKVSIQSGISVGDQVVTDGADKLRDKSKVVLRDPNAPPAPVTQTPNQTRRPRSGAGQ
jgi:multidrug efflux system membrane fusion protein